MNAFDAASEEDWPKTAKEKRLYAQLDDSVLCSICRDYFNTPLSLLCGHSFCAECIRSNIQYQEQASGKACCPQCREPTDSRQIHANHQLREIVKHYLVARPHLIAAVSASAPEQLEGPARKRTRFTKEPQKAQDAGAGKRTQKLQKQKTEAVINLDSASDAETPQRELRRRGSTVDYKQSGSDSEAGVSSEEEFQEEEDVSDASTSPGEKPDESPDKKEISSRNGRKKAGKLPSNWATCPVCSQNFPMAIFNDHLDRCLKEQEGGGEGDGGKAVGNQKPGRASQKPKLSVPPKLLLSLEKPNALRDRLKRFGLSAKGSRQELEQRYTRFRVEVQTALDRCEVGATYLSLARRVMSRETSENNASAKPALMRAAAAKKPTAAAQESGFDDLIRATRARKAAQKQQTPPPCDHAKTQQGDPDTEPRDAATGKGSRGQQHEQGGSSAGPAQWGRGFRRQSQPNAPNSSRLAGSEEQRNTTPENAESDVGTMQDEIVADSEDDVDNPIMQDRRIAQLSQ